MRLGDIADFAEDLEIYAVFEFHTQQFMGLFGRDDNMAIEVPAHEVRVLRIAPWDGLNPVILGTDLHITGSSAEIEKIAVESESINGKLDTRWQYPVVITAGFPRDGDVLVRSTTVAAGGKLFEIGV